MEVDALRQIYFGLLDCTVDVKFDFLTIIAAHDYRLSRLLVFMLYEKVRKNPSREVVQESLPLARLNALPLPVKNFIIRDELNEYYGDVIGDK